jgi:speckle-type POZ protein
MFVFEIFDYSQHRSMRTGEFIRSSTFSVGGYDWAICFYPSREQNDWGYITVYLELLSVNTKVWASCDLRLVDQTTGLSTSLHKTELRVFNSSNASRFAPQTGSFMNRSQFDASLYLKDDHLTIQCITTVKQLQVSAPELLNEIEVPLSNSAVLLGKLLETGEGADVTFSVGGQTFTAHKIVLAMRSPVFKAELFGQIKEANEQLVTIQDMKPDVFRALLYFIYTDSLRGMDGQDGEGKRGMIRHLLVAADRYAVERMKLVCASILCKNLDAKNVSATLALAYQHNCDKLKDVCLEFITSSSSVMDSVVATQGFQNLKATCPSALVDAFEKLSKRFRKT